MLDTMQETLTNVITKVQKKVDPSHFCYLSHYIFNQQKDYLGEGSFGNHFHLQNQFKGKVYRGQNLTTKQTVAVKIMNLSEFKDPYMKQSLKNEILVMKKISGQHVVQIIDVLQDQQDTELYIILEFCEQGDLRNVLKKFRKLNEQEAKEIINQILDGLHQLILKGYIHRDIKPENILVKNKVFKVADFGFAKKIDISGHQKIRDCVGTPLYMSPQLLERKPYTAKSDIWSIGLMYYELLFGKAPWPHRNMESYLEYIKREPLRFPYDVKISSKSMDFIKRCLEIDENKRIGWNEIFQHPLICQQQQKMLQHQASSLNMDIEFDEYERNIIANLQEVSATRNKDFRKIFSGKNQTLNIHSFYQLLLSIDPNITKFEAERIFRKFDKDGDKLVSQEEFQRIYCQYDFSNTNDHVKPLLIELREIIDKYSLKLEDIFWKFDKDISGIKISIENKLLGTLDLHEFSGIIKIIAPYLPNYEIEKIFRFFDQDQDNSISFQEFQQKLAKPKTIQCDKQKAKRVFYQLRYIIKKNNINLAQLFMNVNKSHNQQINIQAFNHMIRKIDQSLGDEECQYLFQVFDKDRSGTIEFNEFSKLLIG